MTEINTHGLIVDFGRHKNTPWTRVPLGYLKWMIRSEHDKKDIAKAEMDRRGSHTPECEISGHAIDRASQSCISRWMDNRDGNEGLHAWLARSVMEAVGGAGERDARERYIHNGLKMVIQMEAHHWPVLITVMPGRRPR